MPLTGSKSQNNLRYGQLLGAQYSTRHQEEHEARARQTRQARETFRLEDKRSSVRKACSPF